MSVCKERITDIEKAGKAEQKQAFIELRARGLSLRKAAKRLSIAVTTASRWQAELEERISVYKAIELEALQEQYYLSKEARIHFLGEQLQAIQKELDSRSLEDVPTAKLLEYKLQYFEALKEEFTEPVFLTEEQAEEILLLRQRLGYLP